MHLLELGLIHCSPLWSVSHRLLLGFIKLSKSLVFLSILCTVAKAIIQNLFSGFVFVSLRTVRFFFFFATSLFIIFYFLANSSPVSFSCLNQAKTLPSPSSGASEFTCLSYNPPEFYVELDLSYPSAQDFPAMFPKNYFSFSS